VIKAKGEAESINLRGKALQENPSVLDLQVVERWDGATPLVVGPGAIGADLVLPLGNLGDQKGAQPQPSPDAPQNQPRQPSPTEEANE
jgi:prohibitin 2